MLSPPHKLMSTGFKLLHNVLRAKVYGLLLLPVSGDGGLNLLDSAVYDKTCAPTTWFRTGAAGTCDGTISEVTRRVSPD